MYPGARVTRSSPGAPRAARARAPCAASRRRPAACWRRSRGLRPQLIDQPIAGDELVRVNQQDREQGPLLRCAQRHLGPPRRTSSGPRIWNSIAPLLAGSYHRWPRKCVSAASAALSNLHQRPRGCSAERGTAEERKHDDLEGHERPCVLVVAALFWCHGGARCGRQIRGHSGHTGREAGRAAARAGSSSVARTARPSGSTPESRRRRLRRAGRNPGGRLRLGRCGDRRRGCVRGDAARIAVGGSDEAAGCDQPTVPA